MRNESKKIYLVFVIIPALLYWFMIRNGFLYGSSLDWQAQHFEIANYLRTLFYSTGDILPDFTMNLGAG